MLAAIAGGRSLPPEAPTLADGYRVAEVVDTMLRAAQERTWLPVAYREPARG
jgi:predicted dehydrogenase